MKLVVCVLLSAFISSSALASGWFPKLPNFGKLAPKNDHPWNEGYDLSEGGDNTRFGGGWSDFASDFRDSYNEVAKEAADSAIKWTPAYLMSEAFSHKFVVPAIKSQHYDNIGNQNHDNGGGDQHNANGSQINAKICRAIGGAIVGPIIGAKAPVWCVSWTKGDPLGTTACITGLTTSAGLLVDIACEKICEKK
jgi:hypothetical protein